jgi:hypothetical protein
MNVKRREARRICASTLPQRNPPRELGAVKPWSGSGSTWERVGCKEKQEKPRKNPCISLDSLGRIGAFQRVTANPNKKILRPLNSPLRLRAEP